jgi:hypothetical protein
MSDDFRSKNDVSFVDQMPHLLHSKADISEYSFFDATKLRLFAGPNIWKFTNLLHTASTDATLFQQKQAPKTPQKHRTIERTLGGNKRPIRIDMYQSQSIDQLMSNTVEQRERKIIGTMQSSLLLRQREKYLNQMQLTRKLCSLVDLTNLHHFPHVNIDLFNSTDQHEDQLPSEINEFNGPGDGERHIFIFDHYFEYDMSQIVVNITR